MNRQRTFSPFLVFLPDLPAVSADHEIRLENGDRITGEIVRLGMGPE